MLSPSNSNPLKWRFSAASLKSGLFSFENENKPLQERQKKTKTHTKIKSSLTFKK